MPSLICVFFTGKRAYLLGSLGSGRLLAVGEEGVASVLAGHGVHHQTQIPDLARRLEQGNQRVFEQVVRDVPDVDLQNFNFFLNSFLNSTSCPCAVGPVAGPSQSGGGPPYFLCPTVISSG